MSREATFDFWTRVSRLFTNSPAWLQYPTPPSEMPPRNGSLDPAFGAETSTADLPTRTAYSYFPSSRRTSFSSNTSTDGPATPDIATTHDHFTSPTSTLQTKAVVLDALQRDYPVPKEEASLEEMLARPPQKWSVGHYVKTVREAKPPVQDKDERAKAFDLAKKELLAAKAQLDGSR